jgi:hypothetical protein
MTPEQFIVCLACLTFVFAMALGGAFWLGMRIGVQALARELVDRELQAMLSAPDAVDEELWAMLDDEDDDDGVKVLR